MEKRFWSMSKEEIDAVVERHGLTAWKDKIARDRAAAPQELAQEPNPWAQSSWDVRRQNVVSSLAPQLADRWRSEAGVEPEEAAAAATTATTPPTTRRQ